MSNVIVCASNEVKSVLQALTEESKLGEEVKNAIFNELEALPPCEGLLPIDFEEAGKATGKKGGKKRKPSAYNLFVSDCMSAKDVKSFAEAGGKMKECAVDWKKGGDKLKKEYEAKLAKIQSGAGTA